MKARMTGGIKGAAALLAGCLLAGLLAGCGQKGPLYPPDAETAAEPARADVPAENATEPTDALEPAETAER